MLARVARLIHLGGPWRFGIMATQDLSRDHPGIIDRTGRRGSILLVLLVAAALVALAIGLTLIGRGRAESYVMAVLAALGMIGVFALLAAAAGIVRFAGSDAIHPMLKGVVDAARDGILITTPAGRALYANHAYRTLIGADGDNDLRSIEGTLGSDPNASEAIYRLFKAAREGRPLAENLYVAPERGHPVRWIRIDVMPLAGEHRQPLIVWTARDMTRERAHQEDAFRQLQHAVDYLDQAPAGFFSVNNEGAVVYLNATLANWLGYDVAKVGARGLSLSDFVAGDGVDRLVAIPGGPHEVRTDVVDLDLKSCAGEIVPVRLYHRVAFAADGARDSVSALVIRRSGRDDDRQRASAVSFMRFFQNTPMAIATIDTAGRIARANGLFARLLQSTRPGEDTRLEGSSILDIVADRDRAALETHIARAVGRQGDVGALDAALAGKGERWARFYVTAVDQEDDEAVIVYALEITEQRSLEHQFLQSQKLEIVGQLAGGLAHDFNNVLSAIVMATDFLLNAHRPTDPSFQDIMQIKQNANRAAGLVRQLLAFSRRQTLRPQVLDLGEALSDLSILLRRLIGEKVTLDVQARDVWPIKADLSQFEQVIVNLAVNARDAMPNGGRLSVRASNVAQAETRRFEGWSLPAGDYVVIEVSDTGTGIAPDIIDRIFEPFFSTKDVGKGTGLGLSTVYGIVKQTGGFIHPESEIGRGTVFRIFLPRHSPRPEEVAAPKVAAVANRPMRAPDDTGQGTILLVEDEEGLRGLNARGLKSRGYNVLEAGNGVEAIEAIERHPGKIDLVISDVVMPEMDGPALLKELRQRGLELKIIFVSGYAEEAFAKSLPEAGQFEFLPKPFTLKQLIAKVKDTLPERAQSRSA
jgi:two-component system, cell cycle sensor histidine kinase and response regulator CckA